MSVNDTNTATRKKIKIRKAPKYCNIFHNNDVTSFEAVMVLLIKVFNYDEHRSIMKAKEVHENGKGIVHIGSKEVCDGKQAMLSELKHKLPTGEYLQTSVEVYDEEED